VSSDQVVVTAFKPAEDPGHGFVVRAWELGGLPRAFEIDASAISTTSAWHTTLVETDIAGATVTNGVISAAATANEITTYRMFNGHPIFADGFESGNTSGWTAAVP
jgi:alpha-mannosidase